MGKYGHAAILATNIVRKDQSISPRIAWDTAVGMIFQDSTSSQQKGCPRNAFLGLCEDEDNCKVLDDQMVDFDCIIKVAIVDTENGENCGPYGVEFEKYHCGGGASSLMSYGFNGCYEDGGITYLSRSSVINYSVFMEAEEDYILFKLKDASQKILTTYKCTGGHPG